MAPLNNRKYLKAFRKKLRKQGTSAEAVLWTYLKGKKIGGIKFRRQHSIGKYIIDFYAPSSKIAIELDGEVHNWGRSPENDSVKDRFLQSLGITILRFENKWIFDDPDYIINTIKASVADNQNHKKQYSTTTEISPPLQGGVSCVNT